MIKNPFLGPKYFTNRFSCTNTKLNQVTIQFYAKIVARLLLKLGWDILPHICRIAAANPKWLPLCRGNWKVRQNDQYTSKRPMKHFTFTTYFWVNSSGILLIISNSYERMRNIYSVVSTLSGRTTQRKMIIKLINFATV